MVCSAEESAASWLMKTIEEGVQRLEMKIRNAELYSEGATVFTPCSRLQQDCPN